MASKGFSESIAEMENRLTKGMTPGNQRPQPGKGEIPEMDMTPPEDEKLGGTQQRNRIVRRVKRNKQEDNE